MGVRIRWNSMMVTTWPMAQSRHLRAAPSVGRGAVTGWKGAQPAERQPALAN